MKTEKITFFDWRKDNKGVGVSFTGEENGCSCYCDGSPEDPEKWDISIHNSKAGLTKEEYRTLVVLLADMWRLLQRM